MSLPLVTAALALTVALCPLSARAYCRTTTAAVIELTCPAPCVTRGLPLSWGNREIHYAFNDRGFSGLSEQELRGAVARAFASWASAECEDGEPVGFTFRELAEATPLTVGPRATEPNLNVFSMLSESEWAEHGYAPQAYAFTDLSFDVNSGEIVGADIAFNGGLMGFDVCSDDGCAMDAIDLENVASHEIGHFLGLAHSDDETSTMWCDAQLGDRDKRSLGADDVAGLCAIYGDGSAFAVERAPASAPKQSDASGCSLSVRSRDRVAFPALLLAALTLTMRRRTRPRAAR